MFQKYCNNFYCYIIIWNDISSLPFFTYYIFYIKYYEYYYYYYYISIIFYKYVYCVHICVKINW